MHYEPIFQQGPRNRNFDELFNQIMFVLNVLLHNSSQIMRRRPSSGEEIGETLGYLLSTNIKTDGRYMSIVSDQWLLVQ